MSSLFYGSFPGGGQHCTVTTTAVAVLLYFFAAPVVDNTPTSQTSETAAPEFGESPSGISDPAEAADTAADVEDGGDDGGVTAVIIAVISAVVLLAMGGGLAFAFKNNNINCCQRLQVNNSTL